MTSPPTPRTRRVPVKPIAILTVFALLQLVGLRAYHQYSDLLHNVDLATVREAYLPAMLHPPSTQLAPAAGTAQSLPVLVYHGVVAQPDGSNVTIADFRAQMFGLKRAGYQAIALSAFQRYLDGGPAPPAKSFLLTFDDGRKDSYYPVDPLLKALDYHATMFVITQHAFDRRADQSSYYLGADELERMRRGGRWELQPHAHLGHNMIQISADGRRGHFYSNLMWLADAQRMETVPEFQQRVRDDLRTAKRLLQHRLGGSMDTFAFPFGDYGQDTLNNPAAKEIMLAETQSLFRYAFAQEEVRTATYGQNRVGMDLRTLTRIKVYPQWTADNLRKVIEVGTPKVLPYQDTFTDHNGWMGTDGTVQLLGSDTGGSTGTSTGSGGLLVAARPTGTGGSVALDGSAAWRDYRFTAALQWSGTAGNVTLVARSAGQNSVGCTLTPLRLQVEQRTGGVRQVLAETLLAGPPAPDQSLELTIRGSTVSCGLPGGTQTGAAVAGVPATGGVGVRVWNPQPGQAEVKVHRVDVTAI